MASGRDTYRDVITWGSTLDYEPPEISRKAKLLFQRAKTNLSLNVAMYKLTLIKPKNSTTSTSDRKALETSLQRTSGVSPKIFGTGLRELRQILGTTGVENASPARKSSPSKTKKALMEGSSTSPAKVGVGARKKNAVHQSDSSAFRDTLMAATTPLKRPASTLLADDDDEDNINDPIRSSPTAKRRVRQRPNAPTPGIVEEDLSGRTPRQTDHLSVETSSVQTIRNTPLALPIHRPIKPMSIFNAHPILNPAKPNSNPIQLINFSDWNWKNKLFDDQWSLDDIREWERWNQKSLESSLT
ncbi:hypothetical protein PSHT_09098 [Puccinia striiformis]|uniref:Uncharacterized protein n=1 Tax=Puccinia striiformis TaxID=27350 RepID=A0A2S4VIZ0_9BASI|nr:hypothetical protein PSHT_09098 [Puccinia striiformis]